MATDYIIRGEAGKTLDATPRLLGADLLATNATLRFESLESDVLQWTCRTESLTASETIIPDVGQRIELWSADNSTRYFRGWVTQARLQNYGVQVVVEGPWQWLVKTDVSSSQTLQTTQDRPTVIFNQDTVANNITALVNRAIAIGLPIALGTVAASYTVPKLQLSTITFADAFSELMRWTPDAVAWWNYSGSGTPTINVSRRSAMTTQEYTIGTSPLAEFDLTGRPDLVPSRVEIKYIERQIDERPALAEQTAGTAAAGRVQTIGISGSEFDTFLPADDYESYVAKTVPSTTSWNSYIFSMIPAVVESQSTFNGLPSINDITVSTGQQIRWYNTVSRVSSMFQGYLITTSPGLSFTNPATGLPVSLTGKNLVVSLEAPSWGSKIFANPEKIRISGRIYALRLLTKADYTSGTYQSFNVDYPIPWMDSFPWNVRFTKQYYAPNHNPISSSNPIIGYFAEYLGYDFEIDAFITTSSYPTNTTFYKPQDYDYTAPPSGLASALLSSQSFTPYEGSIRLQPGEIGALTNLLNYKFEIAGAHSSLDSAGALPRAVTYDLLSQSIDIEVGAPTRFDFSTLGAKLRPTPQTNITINQ